MRQTAQHMKEGPMWGCRPGALDASDNLTTSHRKVPSL